jgi:hypothetical protein
MSLRSVIRFLVCLSLLAGSATVFAQSLFVPLHRAWTNSAIASALTDSLPTSHLAEKPLLAFAVNNSGIVQTGDSLKAGQSRFRAKLLYEHLVNIREEQFALTIDPVLDVCAGRDIADTGAWKSANLFFNQRGLLLQGRVGQKVFFETSFFETQAIVPDYLRAFNNRYGIYPGFGRTKAYKENGYDFALATSHVTFVPRKSIMLQIGQGKHHYGHGYRSMLWSDGAFVYPFVKARFTFLKNRLTYSTLFAELRTTERLPRGEVPESLFKPKSASVHYLSYTPHPAIEIGLFESIIWNRYDSTGTHAPSEIATLPLIGLHSAVKGLDDENNGMLGLNASWRFKHKFMLYTQCAADHISNKRLGYQFGFRAFNLLKGLNLQAEYNSASDFFYASRFELQSYSHVNQPLGHPAGGAFREWVLITTYHKNRFWTELKVNSIKQSQGPGSDFEANPADIFQTFAAWPENQRQQLDIECGWILQPQTRTSLVAGCTLRNRRIETGEAVQTTWLWLGLRAQLLNHYTDYQ